MDASATLFWGVILPDELPPGMLASFNASCSENIDGRDAQIRLDAERPGAFEWVVFGDHARGISTGRAIACKATMRTVDCTVGPLSTLPFDVSSAESLAQCAPTNVLDELLRSFGLYLDQDWHLVMLVC